MCGFAVRLGRDCRRRDAVPFGQYFLALLAQGVWSSKRRGAKGSIIRGFAKTLIVVEETRM